MKLLIVAGGGGHFAPALAVIEKLSKGIEVLLVGRKYSLEGDSALSFEYQSAKKLGIPFQSISTGRLQRHFTGSTITSIFKIPRGLFQSIIILRKFKPDVVLSFGGYVSVPIVLAAAIFRIPIVIHEQTMGAGAANKFAARFAKKICISWESSRKYFPAEKVALTGNPLRKFQISNFKIQFTNGSLPLLYITGGSAGAHAINLLTEGCIEELLKKFRVIHQSGDAREFGDYERLKNLRESLDENLQKRYLVKKFIDPQNVFEILSEADLVIGRSGINTVTELLYFGTPSILIPLPYGQKNEQLTNALYIKDKGLAEVIEQEGLEPKILYREIINVFSKIEIYKLNGAKARELIVVDAPDRIIDEVKNAKNQTQNQ